MTNSVGCVRAGGEHQAKSLLDTINKSIIIVEVHLDPKAIVAIRHNLFSASHFLVFRTKSHGLLLASISSRAENIRRLRRCTVHRR
jgi:hypothetical protein